MSLSQTERTQTNFNATRVLRDICNTNNHTDSIIQTYSQASVEHAIETCEDVDLLNSVRKTLWGTDYEYLRAVAEFHRQKIDVVGSNFTFTYNFKSFGTFTSTEIDFQSWNEVYTELSVKELVRNAVWTQAQKNIARPELYRILKGFAYLKSANDTHLIDAFDLNNRGEGLSKTEQAERIGETLQAIHPVIAGLLCGYIQKITTNKRDSSNSNGSAKDNGRWLNLVNENQSNGVSTVAHEIGHTLQYAFNTHCRSSIDNRDSNHTMNASALTTEYASYATQFQEDIQYLWNLFKSNELDSVRSYQEKNFNEFFACAFEYWVHPDGDEPSPYKSFFNKYCQRLEPYQ